MKHTIKRSTLGLTLLSGIVFFAFLGSQAFSQSPNPTSSPTEVGRYQLIRMDVSSVYLLDTKTGRTWYRFGRGASKWEEQNLPPTLGKSANVQTSP